MQKIKNMTLQFRVTAEVRCTEPSAFETYEDFHRQDGGDMKKYLKEKLEESLTGAFQAAASVVKHKVKLSCEGMKLWLVKGKAAYKGASPGGLVVAYDMEEAKRLATESGLPEPSEPLLVGYAAAQYCSPKVLFVNVADY